MRARLRQTRRGDRAPLTCVARHRRAREMLVANVIGAVIGGATLGTISLRPHMPRRATFAAWVENDAAFRGRYTDALGLQRHQMAEVAVAIADGAAAKATGRHRIAAAKLQIEARKLCVKLIMDDAREAARRQAHDERGEMFRGRPAPVTAADIAILNAAYDEMMAGGAAADAAASTDDDAADDPGDAEASETDDDATECHSPSWSAKAALGRACARPFTNMWPRVVGAAAKETRGSSPFGEDDEKENNVTPPSAPPSPPPPDDSDDDSDEPRTHTLPLTVAEEEALIAQGKPLPAAPKPASARSDSDDDSDEPRYHVLPLTVAEEEALNARRQGKPLPAPPPSLDDDDSDEPRTHTLPLTVAEEEALIAQGKPLPAAPKPASARSDSDDDDSDEPRYHTLPLTVAEEEALRARQQGKPPAVPPKPPREPPPTPFVPRWDTGGVAAPRRQSWDDYDPLKW